MSWLRWIWAYLFDCVHSHTTWPHQNQFGLAYVCCLECGREMPYSLEHMQIVGRYRKRNIWASRSAATAALIMLKQPSLPLGFTHSVAAADDWQIPANSVAPEAISNPENHLRLFTATPLIYWI